MATATSGPTPRPELRDRILEAARAEPPTVVSLEEHRRSRAVPVLGADGGARAVAALALGIWGAGASRDLDDARAALGRQQVATAVLSDPDARAVDLETGDGRLVVGEDGSAVLVLELDGAGPGGQDVRGLGRERRSAGAAGLFDGAGERDVVPVEETVGDGSVVMVTVENAGGVDAPTSDPIVVSQPA